MKKFTIIPFVSTLPAYNSLFRLHATVKPIDPQSDIVLWGSHLNYHVCGGLLPANYSGVFPNESNKHLVASWGAEFETTYDQYADNALDICMLGKDQSRLLDKLPRFTNHDIRQSFLSILGVTGTSLLCGIRCVAKLVASVEQIPTLDALHSGLRAFDPVKGRIGNINTGKTDELRSDSKLARFYVEMQRKSRFDFASLNDYLKANPKIKNVTVLADYEVFGGLGIRDGLCPSRYELGARKHLYQCLDDEFLRDYHKIARTLVDSNPTVKFLLLDVRGGNSIHSMILPWRDNATLGSLQTTSQDSLTPFVHEITIQ